MIRMTHPARLDLDENFPPIWKDHLDILNGQASSLFLEDSLLVALGKGDGHFAESWN